MNTSNYKITIVKHANMAKTKEFSSLKYVSQNVFKLISQLNSTWKIFEEKENPISQEVQLF